MGRWLALLCLLPVLAAGQAFDGLTLVEPWQSRAPRLVDNDGRTVNSWRGANLVSYMPYLMPDSTLWRPSVHPGASIRGPAYGGLVEQYDWDGEVIRSFTWAGPDHGQHHDIEPMPNGNVLILSWDRRTRAEAQAMGRVNVPGSHVLSEMIVEYDPVADSVVWEWRLWDHLVQDVDSTKPNYGAIRDHPERLNINLATIQPQHANDWLHFNIVTYNARRDEIVFSSRYLDEFFIIDHSTTAEEARGSTGGRHGKGGNFLYRWGNPQNYGRGTAADRRFYVVHGANWIPAGFRGEGNILVFNNGVSRPGGNYSSVEEIAPPLDSNDRYHIHPDSAFGPAEPAWTYSNPGVLYSSNMSGAYRLPNDNTVICEAVSGRVTEVSYQGEVVWQYAAGAWTGRAMKYPRDFTVGTAEPRPAPVRAAVAGPTIVRGSLHLGAGLGHNPDSPGGIGLCPAHLLDAAGRKVMDLQPGENDVRYLSPGVYFIRAEGSRGQGFEGSSRKVLILR